MGSKSVRIGSTAGILVLAAGLVWVGACDSGGGTEPPTEQRSTIQVTVTADGSGREGVTVRLFETGGTTPVATQQTGSNGAASFSNLDAGSYEAEAVVPSGLELAAGESARKAVTVAAGATASVAIALVSSGGSNGDDVVEIHLTAGNRFSPSSVTITPGTTVRWINDTGTFHTITPDEHSEWSRVEMTTEGQEFSHTFENLGDFDYFCEPHLGEGMTGSITVAED